MSTKLSKTYHAPSDPRVTTEGLITLPPGVFRDKWEDFDQESLKKYFEDGYNIFLANLEELRLLKRKVTIQEEKDLRFMLDSLIYTKNAMSQKD